MLQKYIRYCTKKVLEAINIGTMELVNMGHTVFTTEFVLLGLLVQNDSSIIAIMEQLKLDTEGIKKRLTDDIFASLDNQTANIAKTLTKRYKTFFGNATFHRGSTFMENLYKAKATTHKNDKDSATADSPAQAPGSFSNDKT